MSSTRTTWLLRWLGQMSRSSRESVTLLWNVLGWDDSAARTEYHWVVATSTLVGTLMASADLPSILHWPVQLRRHQPDFFFCQSGQPSLLIFAIQDVRRARYGPALLPGPRRQARRSGRLLGQRCRDRPGQCAAFRHGSCDILPAIGAPGWRVDELRQPADARCGDRSGATHA